MKNLTILNKKDRISALYYWLLFLFLCLYCLFLIIEYKIKQNLFIYTQAKYQQKIVEGKIIYLHQTSHTSPAVILKTKNGKIYLSYNYIQDYQNFHYGDKIKLLCKIKDISFRDRYSIFLHHAFNVDKIGYIIQIIHKQPSTYIGYQVLNWLNSISLNTRQYIIGLLKNNLSPPGNNVILRLTLGYTDYELNEIKQYFQDAGVAHVLVVSGLHIGLVYLFISFITKLILQNVMIKTILNVIFTALFMIMVGLTAPVVRATVIIFSIAFSELLQRKNSNIHSLLLAAILILVVSPFNLFNGSFQLTFAACFGILYFYNFFYFYVKTYIENKNKILQNIVKLFLTTTSAQLMVIPLIMYYFNKISLISFISNIFVIPLTSILLWLSLVYYILSFIFGNIWPFFWQILQTLTNFYVDMVKFFAQLPISNFSIATPSVGKVLGYYIFIILSAIILKNKNIRYFLVVVLIGILFLCSDIFPPRQFKVVFLDVGLGDSILVRTEKGRTILIDTADSETTVKYKILPSLYKNKITSIDHLIITHFHFPHYGGAKCLLKNFKVKNIYIPDYLPSQYNDYREIFTTVKERKINLIVVNSTKTIFIDNGSVELLPGFVSYFPDEPLFTDYNSIAIDIKYKNYIITLNNDIPASKINTARYKNTAEMLTIIQLPRHGKYIEDLNFIEIYKNRGKLAKTKILFVVVSTDGIKFNKNTAKLPIFSTDEHGEIEINFKGSGKIQSIKLLKGKTSLFI